MAGRSEGVPVYGSLNEIRMKRMVGWGSWRVTGLWIRYQVYFCWEERLKGGVIAFGRKMIVDWSALRRCSLGADLFWIAMKVEEI